VVGRGSRVGARPAAGLEWPPSHPIPQPHAEKGTHAQPHARPLVRGPLIRWEVERLPRPTKTPVPLWFWWWAPTPPDLAVVWQASTARFSLAHTFRFFKHTRNWTTPTLRQPAAADRWTWRLLLASVQVRLARDLVADVRLPWQRPLPPERRTPARVRRGFASLLTTLRSSVNVPQPWGRSPGRPKGQRVTERITWSSCGTITSSDACLFFLVGVHSASFHTWQWKHNLVPSAKLEA